MEAFNVRNDLGHDAALSEASCTLEQALALIDSLNDDTQETKHQNRLYAVEFMVEAAMELVQHAMTKAPEEAA